MENVAPNPAHPTTTWSLPFLSDQMALFQGLENSIQEKGSLGRFTSTTRKGSLSRCSRPGKDLMLPAHPGLPCHGPGLRTHSRHLEGRPHEV